VTEALEEEGVQSAGLIAQLVSFGSIGVAFALVSGSDRRAPSRTDWAVSSTAKKED